MENMPTLSRRSLLQWVNRILKVKYRKLKQLGNGEAYCLLFDMVFPDFLNLDEVVFQSPLAVDHKHNFNVLKNAFEKLEIIMEMPPESQYCNNVWNSYCFLDWFYKVLNEKEPKILRLKPKNVNEILKVVDPNKQNPDLTYLYKIPKWIRSLQHLLLLRNFDRKRATSEFYKRVPHIKLERNEKVATEPWIRLNGYRMKVYTKKKYLRKDRLKKKFIREFILSQPSTRTTSTQTREENLSFYSEIKEAFNEVVSLSCSDIKEAWDEAITQLFYE